MSTSLAPVSYPDWNQHIAQLPGATIFHTAEWSEVLKSSYGYTPNYFISRSGDEILSCLPIMGIESFLTGRRGVALPFTDECRPLSTCTEAFRPVFEQVRAHALRKKWRHIELRGYLPEAVNTPATSTFLVHRLDLNATEEAIYRNLRSSTRRNVEKAEKNNIKTYRLYDADAVDKFHKLNLATRRSHGLPPQPARFFKSLHRFVIGQGHGFVLIAVYESEVIAGAVFLYFNRQLVFKYGASDKKHLKLRANNLIIWRAIQWGIQNGCTQFSFGRTELENVGLRRFKRSWGAMETKLYYYRYDPKAGLFCSVPSKIKSSYSIFKILPRPLLKVTGRMLYRHIG